MYPLIEIKTIPIEIEMKVNHAHLEYARGTAEMEVSRDRRGLSIRSRPIRVNIDTFEARNSVVPTAATSIQQAAERGRQSVYEATAAYARQGRMMMETKIGEDVIRQLAAASTGVGQDVNVNIDFLPKTGAELSWDGGEMRIRYEMDKLNFDWRMQKAKFEFIPGDIEISVKQWPDVLIKYVGGPLYVPPSADPDYVPTDLKA